MAQPIFPNERLVDVYKALELGNQVDVYTLESEIQSEGVNGSVRDYDLYYSIPGNQNADEFLIARPRTGKGVQYACEYSNQNHGWTPNGQWDSASQDLVDPSQPVPGVNAPVGQQQPSPYTPGTPNQPPPLPPQLQPQFHYNSNRMDTPRELTVDKELAEKIGTGAKGDRAFGDALDALLDGTSD